MKWARAIGILVLLSGCAMEGRTAESSSGPYTGYEGDTAGPGSSGSGSGTAEPGTLTAGAWDDNRNFERFTELRQEMIDSGASGVVPFTEEEHAAAQARFGGARPAHTTLDVALVIDTTGSMGDEIRYLQAELRDIATRVHAAYPGASARWALVLYRVSGDEYVVRTFDFEANVDTFRANLAAQSADGGGDYPEASHAALLAMANLAWREGASTARLAFWVADAPHHAEVASEQAMAVRSAADLDVHIYPVASSGIDLVTEHSMRASAQLTGGRYLFLTDDSGVGGSHLEPSIPCYFVTRLNDAMLRMVDMEMSGEYREPEAASILRTGGDPTDGACTLESGETVLIF